MIQFLLQSAKAVVPNLVGLLLVALAGLGITPAMNVEEALTTAITLFITSVMIWFTPNKQ